MSFWRAAVAAGLILGPVAVSTETHAAPTAVQAGKEQRPEAHAATASDEPKLYTTQLAPAEKKLVDQLAATNNEKEAETLRQQLISLRLDTLRPATMLLMRKARRELIDEKKPTQAVDDVSAALSLQADAAVLWLLRGQAKLEAGDTEGSISDIGVALHKNDSDAVAWKNLAQAEDARGDGRAALLAWEHVLLLDPLSPGGEKMLQKLKLKAFGRPT